MGSTLTLDKPKFENPTYIGCTVMPGQPTPVLPSVLMSRISDVLRLMFSDPGNIWHTQIRDMVYSEDMEKTKVFIMMGFATTPETEQADTFPRVVVNGTDAYFGALTPVTDGLFTNSGSAPGTIFGTDDGMEHYDGTLTITCVSRGALEALLMAESIMMFFRVNSLHIRKDLRLSSFDVRVLKSPRKAEGVQGLYESSLSVGWSSGMTWSMVEDLPRMADSTGLPVLQ